MNFAQSSSLNYVQATLRAMSMGTRLQEALDLRRRTAPDVIEACRLSKGAVYNILNDTTKPEKVRAETINKVAGYLGISRDWLVWGKGDPDDVEKAAEEGWADIKGVRQAAALGAGAIPEEYAETHKLKFRADSLRRKKLKAEDLAVLYGKGDSMAPTIEDGDAILFDQSDVKPRDGGLYVISYDGHLMAKRLIKLGGMWFIDSDNKLDPQWKRPVPVDETRDFVVHGRVKWLAGWVD